MYYKNHDRQNFYSMLCQTAKRTQRYNLIQSTQLILPSCVNSQPLAQNKFNNCQPIQNLMGYLLCSNKITFTRAVSRVVSNYLIMSSRCASALYRKRSRDANLLVNARPFYNFLENTLMLEPPSIYANILLQ